MNELVLYSLLKIYSTCSVNGTLEAEFDEIAKEMVGKYSLAGRNEKLWKFYKQSKKIGGDVAVEECNGCFDNISKVCNEVKNKLVLEDRILLLVKILELDAQVKQGGEFIGNVCQTVTQSLSIPSSIAVGIQDFANNNTIEPTRAHDFVLARGKKSDDISVKNEGLKEIVVPGLQGYIYFFKLPDSNSFLLKYYGDASLQVDGMSIVPRKIYFFPVGSVIKGENLSPIYFSQINNVFHRGENLERITLTIDKVEFAYKKSGNGIKQFSVVEHSGQLIGIMGSSGVGKSTLLNLLSGKTKPHGGRVLINGYDIYSEQHSVMGLVGFVPQDDLLFENLTVYQNIYYNANLCFGNLTSKQIKHRVERVLRDLELWEIKDLKVGSPLDKVISGGQRKRLNIGLELIREPEILFIDEPTSGLSSSDSLMVMKLLKAQAEKGKLVVANIHQPSDKLFRLFDRLWVLDKGGFPVYAGPAIEAIDFLNKRINPLEVAESGCLSCESVNPELILEIIERKEVDQEGKLTAKRLVSPEQWYSYYNNNIQSKIAQNGHKEELPTKYYLLPNVIKQLKIYSIRNILAKISNIQYVLLNILEPIILAFVLAFFVKYSAGTSYIFANNKNLPAFIFMSVVVALFMGLSVSAEEIIGDRKIIERESFLNLSRFSYINSKVIYLFSLSAIQMLLFVLVGNSILEIRGLTFQYWLVLFSAACFANLTGLIISAVMNSVVSIYITIPFILVPQILLSGTVVDFDNLHPSLTRKIYVPVVGDVMASRWAYEALAVTQFVDNKYEKKFYRFDQAISQANFRTNFIVPRLQTKLAECIRLNAIGQENYPTIQRHLKFIGGEIEYITKTAGVAPFELIDELKNGEFSDYLSDELSGYLYFIKKVFSTTLKSETAKRDSVYQLLVGKIGTNGIFQLKQNYYNETLANWVLRNDELTKYLETDNRIIQKFQPIFMLPDHPFGRAQLYAPYKLFNRQYVKTIWFNVTVMWLFTLMLYAVLQLKILQRIALLFEQFSKRRRAGKEQKASNLLN